MVTFANWCHGWAEGYYSVQDVSAPTVVIILKRYWGHMKYYRVEYRGEILLFSLNLID
jgi:hypothetical protein